MTDKKIIDYKNICVNYSKEVGCYNTFDGCCIKEQCFTYRLLQSLQSKEQECEELKKENCELTEEVSIRILNTVQDTENRKLSKTLAEIKEIAEKQCNICEALTPIDEYKDCKKCWQGVILQKIREVEDENS